GEIKNLSFHIHRNGEQLKVIPLDNLQRNEKNIVKVEGELDLLELDLKDYDLLAIYLAATVKYPSGEEANLISPIHFIGILPLKEEGNIENEPENDDNGGGGGGGMILRQVMRKQMDLHKGITTLRISRQYSQSDPEKQQKLLEEIRNDQAEVNAQIKALINSGKFDQTQSDSQKELQAALPHLDKALRLVNDEKISAPEGK
ncbi:MAG: hypothetical protein RRY34_10700, partial [Victivallaceae bacterium]